jgi:cation:H+ antiporter
MGLAGMVTPGGIPVSKTALAFDIPVMIGVAIACLPIFFTGRLINRWEGLLFLFYYGFYSIYIILNATRSDDLGTFTAAMAWFVLPLTFLSLLLITLNAIRAPKLEAGRISNLSDGQ